MIQNKTRLRERSNGRDIQNHKMNVQCRSYKIQPLIPNKNKESMVCMCPQPQLILFFRFINVFENWIIGIGCTQQCWDVEYKNNENC